MRLPSTKVARRAIALLVTLGLAPGLFVRSALAPPDHSQRVEVEAIERTLAPGQLGPFDLAGAWSLTSPNSDFGGYSALAVTDATHLLAVSDLGYFLALPIPGVDGPAKIGPAVGDTSVLKRGRDIEAIAYEAASRQLWLSLEGLNTIERVQYPSFKREALARPPAISNWPSNTGPEAIARLADGRFIILSESFAKGGTNILHPAVLFEGDPAEGAGAKAFSFAGASGFRPTDMAQLPDGRVLVLMRRLLWPFPPRFSGRIMIADPREIREGEDWHATELARLEPPLPTDNYEGLAIVPGKDGAVTVWLISDNNQALTQRTLLLKLHLDPARLPPAKQKARESLARP